MNLLDPNTVYFIVVPALFREQQGIILALNGWGMRIIPMEPMWAPMYLPATDIGSGSFLGPLLN